jgi:hypothetical protein
MKRRKVQISRGTITEAMGSENILCPEAGPGKVEQMMIICKQNGV